MRYPRSARSSVLGASLVISALLLGCGGSSGGGANPALLEFDAASFGIGEGGGFVTITVNRVGRTTGAVSVDYATSDGTATAGSDYQTAGGTLNWADGDATAKTFDVAILDDFDFETDETVTLTLSNPVGPATIGGTNPVTLTITDDDLPGNLQFSAATYQVAEGGVTATITVSRVGGVGNAVGVDYTTSDGSAQAPGDYITASGTLNWPAGDATDRTFTVDIVDDASIESNETVNLGLANPTGGAGLGIPSTAVLTILDDDAPSPGTLHFSSASFQVAENTLVATIWVSRTAGSAGPVGISFATSDGTATSPGDYTPTSGSLSWLGGDSTDKSFPVTIIDDFEVEGGETIDLTLSNPTGGATLGSPGTATLTITNDDVPGDLQFSTTSYQVVEGTPFATITVSRVGGVGDAVGVSYATSDGSAQAPGDYTSTIGTLGWLAGDGADKTFDVPITDDGTQESVEDLNLTLSAPTGGAGLGSPITATLTIIDDDTPGAGTLQFSAATYTVGAYDGSILISVTRLAGVNNAVSVQYATSDDVATTPSDYSAASGTLFWGDLDATPQTFTVDIIDDVLAEGDETFTLTLSAPTGGATLGTPSVATVTIQEGWVKTAGNPVFGPAAGPAWDDEGVGQPSVLGPPSGFPQYTMWYQGSDQATGTGQFGYATSSDGVTWTRSASPFLSPGGPGDWDESGIDKPSVIYDSAATTYMLYYTGEDAAGTFQIGLATSTDGINWTESASNPILSPTATGRWDDGGVFFPCVVKDGTTFKMWYTGVAGFAPTDPFQIGMATSTDGVFWTRVPSSPVLSPDAASFEGAGVGMAAVIEDGGSVFRMLYTGNVSWSVGPVQGIGYARSLDGGFTWEKYQDAAALPMPVLDIGAAGDWDEGLIFSATWEAFPPSEMWYEGRDLLGLMQIGRATHP